MLGTGYNLESKPESMLREANIWILLGKECWDRLKAGLYQRNYAGNRLKSGL
jgi:hypothetical protein